MEDPIMFDFIPDTQRISEVFSQALTPTFFLGAVAAFVSLMASRLSAVMERIRTLNAIPEGDQRARLKTDLERLRRRARYLHSGILASLRGGLCATLLLVIMFVSGLFGLKHAFGAPSLFVVATFFLGFALFRFAQEARPGRSKIKKPQKHPASPATGVFFFSPRHAAQRWAGVWEKRNEKKKTQKRPWLGGPDFLAGGGMQ